MKTSLDHLPETKQRDIQTIVNIVREEFDRFTHGEGNKLGARIYKIILFGSYATGNWVEDPENGYLSDYDILVIVNHAELPDESKLWHKIEDWVDLKINAPFGLIVHTLDDINTCLAQGQYFFKDIREQGIELYTTGNKALVPPGKLTVEEQKEIAEKHFEKWFESASDFLITSNFDKSRGKLNKAAFELHQATERFFACTLLVTTNYLPKTHNLKRLRSLCNQQDGRYHDTFPGNTKFQRRCFAQLKNAYIDARYSEHYSISEEELNYLEERVKKLQVLTEEVCKKRMLGLSNTSK